MTKKTKKTKTVKNRFEKIYVDVYLCHVFVSVNQTDAQFQKSLKDSGMLPDSVIHEFSEVLSRKTDVHYGHCSWSDLAGIYFIRIYDYEPNPFYYSVINHEVFHAVHHMLQGKGLELADASEEAYAYMISHLTRKIHELIK